MTISRTEVAGGGILEMAQDAVHDLVARVQLARRRRRAFNQAYSELSALNDRELADIGIARADIGRIARESAAAMLG